MISLNGEPTRWFGASGAHAFGSGWLYEQPYRWLGWMRPKLMTVVVKTLTFEPITGNLQWHKRFGGCVRLLDAWGNVLHEGHWLINSARIAGVVNAVGLTNPGYAAWCEDWWRRYQYLPYNFVVSIMASSVEQAEKMTEAIVWASRQQGGPGRIVGIEVNLSCPNKCESAALLSNTTLSIQIVQAVKAKAASLPVLVKLGPTQNYLAIAAALREIVVGFSINSAPWDLIFRGKPSPLAFLGVNGGVSGKVAQPVLWKMAADLVQLGVPTIGPSVWDYADVHSLFRHVGVQAVHFGALHLRGIAGPTLPTRYITAYQGTHGCH